jgi:hypothetical protein
MARDLTPAMVAELAKAGIKPAMFVEMVFLSGVSRVWSGPGTKAWNNYNWTGLGEFASITKITEDQEIRAGGITLGLTGIPTTLISQVLTECRQRYPVNIWFGLLDTNEAVIADPFQCYSGRMDVPTILEGAQECSVAITVENKLIDMNRTRERRYTHGDQQIDYPGDLGFQYVASMQEWNGVWGKGNAVPSGTPSGGGANTEIGAGGRIGVGGRTA